MTMIFLNECGNDILKQSSEISAINANFKAGWL